MSSGIFTFTTRLPLPTCPVPPIANRDFNDIVTIMCFKGDYDSFYLTSSLTDESTNSYTKQITSTMINNTLYRPSVLFNINSTISSGYFYVPSTYGISSFSQSQMVFFVQNIPTNRVFFVPVKKTTDDLFLIGTPILLTIKVFSRTAPAYYISPINWSKNTTIYMPINNYSIIPTSNVIDTHYYPGSRRNPADNFVGYYFDRSIINFTLTNSSLNERLQTTNDETSFYVSVNYIGDLDTVYNGGRLGFNFLSNVPRILTRVFNGFSFIASQGVFSQLCIVPVFFIAETDFPAPPVLQQIVGNAQYSILPDNSLSPAIRLPICSGYLLFDTAQPTLQNAVLTSETFPVSTLQFTDRRPTVYFYAFNSKTASDTTLYSFAGSGLTFTYADYVASGIYGTPTVTGITFNSATIAIAGLNYITGTFGNSYIFLGDKVTLYTSTGTVIQQLTLNRSGVQNVSFNIVSLQLNNVYSGWYVKFTSDEDGVDKEHPEKINIPSFTTLYGLQIGSMNLSNTDTSRGALVINPVNATFQSAVIDSTKLYVTIDSIDYQFNTSTIVTIYRIYGRVFNNYPFTFKYKYDDTNYANTVIINGSITIATPPEQIIGNVAITFERVMPITLTITGFDYNKIDNNIYKSLPSEYLGLLQITDGTNNYGGLLLTGDANSFTPTSVLTLNVDGTLMPYNTLMSNLYIKYAKGDNTVVGFERLYLNIPPFLNPPRPIDIIYGTPTFSFESNLSIILTISGFDYTALDGNTYTSLPTTYGGTLQVTDGTTVYGTSTTAIKVGTPYNARLSTVSMVLDSTKLNYNTSYPALYLQYSSTTSPTSYRSQTILCPTNIPFLTNVTDWTQVVPVIKSIVVKINTPYILYFSNILISINFGIYVKLYSNGMLVQTLTNAVSMNPIRNVFSKLTPDTAYTVVVQFYDLGTKSPEFIIGTFNTLPDTFVIDNLTPALTQDNNRPSINNSVRYLFSAFRYVSQTGTSFDTSISTGLTSRVFGSLTLGGGLINNYNLLTSIGTFNASNLVGGMAYNFTATYRPPSSFSENIEEYTLPFKFPTLYVAADLSYTIQSVSFDTTGNMIIVVVTNISINNTPCPAGTQLALYDGVYKSNYTIAEDNTVGAIATIVNSTATLYFNLPLPCQYTLAGPGNYNIGQFPTFYINTYPRNSISSVVKNGGWLDPIYPPVTGKLVNTVTQKQIYPLYDFVDQSWNMGTITPTIRTNSSPTGYNEGNGTYVIGIPSYYPNPANWASLSDNFYITTNQNVSVTTQDIIPVGPVGNVFTAGEIKKSDRYTTIGTIGDIIAIYYTDRTVSFTTGSAVTFSNTTVSATGTIFEYFNTQPPAIRVTITAISGQSYPERKDATTTVGGFRVEHWSGDDNTFMDNNGDYVTPPPQIGDVIMFTIESFQLNAITQEGIIVPITSGSFSATGTISNINSNSIAGSSSFDFTIESMSSGFQVEDQQVFSIQFPLENIPAGPRFIANSGDIIILPYPPPTTTTTTTAAPTYTVTNYIICPLFTPNDPFNAYKGTWLWGSIGPSGTAHIQRDLNNRLVTGTNPPPDVTDTYPPGSRMFYIHKPYFEYGYYSKIDVSGVKIANLDVSEIYFGDYSRTLKIVDRNGNDLVIPNYNNPDPDNRITNYMGEDNGLPLYNFVESTYTISYTGTYSEDYEGTYGSPYAGSYTGSYTGSYAGSYTGTYDEIYSNPQPYSGSYTGTYAIPYPPPQSGTYKTVEYTGTFEINPVIPGKNQIISAKTNNDNYGSLTVPFLFRQDGTHNVVIEYSKA